MHLRRPVSSGSVAAEGGTCLVSDEGSRETSEAHVLVDNLTRVVRGADDACRLAAVAVLAGGHLLIEDVPGVGKTMLAKALAGSLGTELSRVQGHPDLLPTDITGISVYNETTRDWEFRPGPVFSHVLLFDELNRTPPRSQAALLESMEERQVTSDGRTWPLPEPHFVVATENPVEHAGTYPLVESQVDRFLLATSLGYPDAATEAALAADRGADDALSRLRPVIDLPGLVSLQREVANVHAAPAVAEYAVAIVRATRTAPGVRLGASPRATIALLSAARAEAFLEGRAYVTPTDVKRLAPAVLGHRLVPEEDDHSISAGGLVVASLLETVPAPRP